MSNSIPDISKSRCFNHNSREAAGRCPECGRFFCRECLTEHDDRILCASCLKKIMEASAPKRRFRIKGVIDGPLRLFTALALPWIFFYYLGQFLLSISSEFHKGSF